VRDALVVDGSGQEPFHASVGIEGGRIVSVGAPDAHADRTIEAGGRLVTPGFVDMHSHSDLALVDAGALEAKLAQGVTLEVLGQDGLSCAPSVASDGLVRDLISPLVGDTGSWDWFSVAEYLGRLDGSTAQNVAYLVPHGTVRACVMGIDDRAATTDEILRMGELVDRAMVEGAFGLSTGLSYPPAHAATTAEVITLARIARAHGGVYVTHLRSYGNEMLEATEEALEIGREAGVPVHFSHLQTPGRQHHGTAPDLLARLDRARGSGIDVTFDVYPYEAASTMLTAFLPDGVRHLSGPGAVTRLADPTVRARVIEEIDRGTPQGMDVAWSDIRVANGLSALGVDDPSLIRIAARRGESIGECVVALLNLTEGRASVIAASTVSSDVDACLRHPSAMIGSDGLLVGEMPHPRAYGAFPRFLRRALGLGVPLEGAIAAMTRRGADRLGLRDRGRVAVGAWADLAIFDPSRFVDRATYDAPRQFAAGMDHVIVNGEIVWEEGAATGLLPGRALSGHREGTT
jgi:N-acyl-D-amino-acid deacylase